MSLIIVRLPEHNSYSLCCSEALARQLQDEENARLHDHYARRDLARLEQERVEQQRAEREREMQERGRQARQRTIDASERPKKKSDCIIM